MSNKKLVVLGIFAVIMIVLAVLQNSSLEKMESGSEGESYLIQGLNPSDIATIVLGRDKDKVTLKQQKGQFVVSEKDNYPAKFESINNLITSCLDIKTTEFYTDDEKNYEELGVTEKDAQNVAKFLNKEQQLITGLVVGKRKKEGQGTFIRRVDDNKVYLTLDSTWFNNRAIEYIDSSLFSIDSKDIESVVVHPGKDSYTLRRKEGSDEISLENIPAGKKKKDNGCKEVFEAVTYLNFVDVRKKTDSIKFDKKYICKLKDSTVYTLDIGQENAKTYIECISEFTDQTPVTKPTAEDSEEELKKKEAKLLARDKAAEFSRKHKGWVYEITNYNSNKLTKKLSELIEDDPNQVKSPPEKSATSDPNS